MTWIRISGGYCSGTALGKDIWSGSVVELSDDGFGGRSLWSLFPEAMFLRALRTEAILLSRWCFTGSGATAPGLHVTMTAWVARDNDATSGCAIALVRVRRFAARDYRITFDTDWLPLIIRKYRLFCLTRRNCYWARHSSFIMHMKGNKYKPRYTRLEHTVYF